MQKRAEQYFFRFYSCCDLELTVEWTRGATTRNLLENHYWMRVSRLAFTSLGIGGSFSRSFAFPVSESGAKVERRTNCLSLHWQIKTGRNRGEGTTKNDDDNSIASFCIDRTASGPVC